MASENLLSIKNLLSEIEKLDIQINSIPGARGFFSDSEYKKINRFLYDLQPIIQKYCPQNPQNMKDDFIIYYCGKNNITINILNKNLETKNNELVYWQNKKNFQKDEHVLIVNKQIVAHSFDRDSLVEKTIKDKVVWCLIVQVGREYESLDL